MPNKLVMELIGKGGKKIAVALWPIVAPIVMDQFVEALTDFSNWIFKKIKGLFVDRNEILEETVQYNIEQCKQNAMQSQDGDQANIWKAKAEVWEEVYQLVAKDGKKMMKEIDELQAEAKDMSETILTTRDKKIEEEVAKTIHALPE